MLVELHIENLGVIERASLALEPGTTALTGETGAGKTMLVEAIELLVGGRADASMVRQGAAEARVDGRFVTSRDGAADEVVLTRVVPAEGRSRAYVDGRPATAATLADRAAPLVDLHGQHAHQSLMSVRSQRGALDEFGGIDLARLDEARGRVATVQAELAALGGDERARAREIDLLRYQVDELDAAGIDDATEDDALAAEEATLADAQGHRDAGHEAVEALRGPELDGGVDGALRAALKALGDRAPYRSVVERLTALAAELDDVAAVVRDTVETIDDDPERLAAIRERRHQLVDLRRKYGESLTDVMAFHRQATEQLAELLDYDRRATALDADLVSALADVEGEAAVVLQARRAAAPRLADEVETRLRELAMPDAAVAVEVGGDPADLSGEQVQFMFSANPGSPLLPLQRVASGGELARAMLALRLTLSAAPVDADAQMVETLVFDEVDAGIGGDAANTVGLALSDLGTRHQVLVVTHLAQVGARADRQHVVSKSVSGGQTFTTVERVDGNARVVEVARMLAGEATDEARRHAATLIGRDPS
jgi:DNA repair protein RecN (Recombination protein N)